MSLFSRMTSDREDRKEVLIVSPDDRFFTSVLCAAGETEWKVRWVRSMERASEEMARRAARVVLYDCHPRLPEWRSAMRSFAATEAAPAVVLASTDVDEAAWKRALAGGAYDLIPRSRRTELLIATLNFAWSRLRRATANEPDRLLVECAISDV